MSEWDFLWGLEGEELDDAMSSGAESWEWDLLAESEAEVTKNYNRKDEWEKLKQLMDSGIITPEVFKKRKGVLFPNK